MCGGDVGLLGTGAVEGTLRAPRGFSKFSPQACDTNHRIKSLLHTERSQYSRNIEILLPSYLLNIQYCVMIMLLI